MPRSIRISTARTMLNSGDSVDISSAEPKRFATFVAQQRKKFGRLIVEL